MTDPGPKQIRRNVALTAILVLGCVVAFAGPRGWTLQEYDGYLHFAAFATISLLAVFAWPRARLSLLLVGLAILAGLTELLQFVPGINRTPSWSDFGFNICGIAAMLGAVAALRAKFRS